MPRVWRYQSGNQTSLCLGTIFFETLINNLFRLTCNCNSIHSMLFKFCADIAHIFKMCTYYYGNILWNLVIFTVAWIIGLGLMVFNVLFQQHFCYIVVVSSMVEETRVPGENHWPTTSSWQTWSHNVVSSTLCHERDSHNFNGDRHCLHRSL